MTETQQPGLLLHTRSTAGEVHTSWTGAANLETGYPIGPETVFNVGSVAKQITAFIAIELLGETLKSPVGKVLPRFAIPDVTFADLIGHQGGVRDAESLLSLAGFRDLDHYTADDLLELCYRQTTRAVAPGQFLYSNTGYLLLAKALETAHGAPLQELADQTVFTPLKMITATFKTDPRQVILNAASAYGRLPAGEWTHRAQPVALPGPGSLWCSVSDLQRWLTHLNEHRPYRPDHLDPFAEQVPYLPSDQPGYRYGAGLYADNEMVFHHGHEQGFSAAVHLDQNGQQVIVLANAAELNAGPAAHLILRDLSSGNDTEDAQTLATRLQASISKDAPTSRRAMQVRADQHTKLGTFSCDDAPGTLRLTSHAGNLHLWRRGAADRLDLMTSRIHRGPGYTLTLDDPFDPTGSSVDRFTLDLLRAPALKYFRVVTGHSET